MSSDTSGRTVCPAWLDHLAIFNPSLGSEDDFGRQIFYCYCSKTDPEAEITGATDPGRSDSDVYNRVLRRIGAAQAAVSFAREFDPWPVDQLETSASRAVIFQLEENWWITASINFSRLIKPDPTSRSKSGNGPGFQTDYLQRDAPPASLFIQYLRQAHQVYLLHNCRSLEEYQDTHGPEGLKDSLELFWSRFIRTWSVSLSGNPAVDVYNGTKLAYGGLLGVGLDEQEWGSSVRELFGQMVKTTDGLIDILAFRYGNAPGPNTSRPTPLSGSPRPTEPTPWFGSGRYPNVMDGMIFGGTGHLLPDSVRDISHWVQAVFIHGERACGLRSFRVRPEIRTERQQARKAAAQVAEAETSAGESRTAKTPTPSESTTPVSGFGGFRSINQAPDQTVRQPAGQSTKSESGFLSYLSFDYKLPTFGLGQKSAPVGRPVSEASRRLRARTARENRGFFIVGLRGSLSDPSDDNEDKAYSWDNWASLGTVSQPLYVHLSDRFLSRWRHQRLRRAASTIASPRPDGEVAAQGLDLEPNLDPDYGVSERAGKGSFDKSPECGGVLRARVVVYIRRPFVFVFVIDPDRTAEILKTTAFLQKVHDSISSVFVTLDSSTSTETSVARVRATATVPSVVHSPSVWRIPGGPSNQSFPVLSLNFSPDNLHISSTIPPIPPQRSQSSSGSVRLPPGFPPLTNWTWLEAIQVHNQLLQLVGDVSTRSRLIGGAVNDDIVPADSLPFSDSFVLEGDREVEKVLGSVTGWWLSWSASAPSPQPTEPSTLSSASSDSLSDDKIDDDDVRSIDPDLLFLRDGESDSILASNTPAFSDSEEVDNQVPPPIGSHPLPTTPDPTGTDFEAGPSSFSHPSSLFHPDRIYQPYRPSVLLQETIVMTRSRSKAGPMTPSVPPLPRMLIPPTSTSASHSPLGRMTMAQSLVLPSPLSTMKPHRKSVGESGGLTDHSSDRTPGVPSSHNLSPAISDSHSGRASDNEPSTGADPDLRPPPFNLHAGPDQSEPVQSLQNSQSSPSPDSSFPGSSTGQGQAANVTPSAPEDTPALASDSTAMQNLRALLARAHSSTASTTTTLVNTTTAAASSSMGAVTTLGGTLAAPLGFWRKKDDDKRGKGK